MTRDAGTFVTFVGPIFNPVAGYANRVLALLPEAEAMLRAAAPADLGTVVLDPGHGGTVKVGGSSPNNAVSRSGVPEKALTLDLCRRLRDALATEATAANVTLTVRLTRESDVNLGIAARAALARDAAALVCIHFNGAADPAISGCETFHRAGGDPGFARAVHAGLAATLHALDPAARDRGCKPDSMTGPGSLGLLRALPASVRAAYVEAEYITNPGVERLLVSGPDAAANRDAVAAGMARAIVGALRPRAPAKAGVQQRDLAVAAPIATPPELDPGLRRGTDGLTPPLSR